MVTFTLFFFFFFAVHVHVGGNGARCKSAPDPAPAADTFRFLKKVVRLKPCNRIGGDGPAPIDEELRMK